MKKVLDNLNKIRKQFNRVYKEKFDKIKGEIQQQYKEIRRA